MATKKSTTEQIKAELARIAAESAIAEQTSTPVELHTAKQISTAIAGVINKAQAVAKLLREDMASLAKDCRVYTIPKNPGKKLTPAEHAARATESHMGEVYNLVQGLKDAGLTGSATLKAELDRYAAAVSQFASLSPERRESLVYDTKEMGLYALCDAIRVSWREANAKPKRESAPKIPKLPDVAKGKAIEAVGAKATVTGIPKSEAAKVREAKDWKAAVEALLDEFEFSMPKHVVLALHNWLA